MNQLVLDMKSKLDGYIVKIKEIKTMTKNEILESLIASVNGVEDTAKNKIAYAMEEFLGYTDAMVSVQDLRDAYLEFQEYVFTMEA